MQWRLPQWVWAISNGRYEERLKIRASTTSEQLEQLKRDSKVCDIRF